MIINLISAKDYTAIKKKDNLTGDELQILQQENFKEQQLQMNCKKIFDSCVMRKNCDDGITNSNKILYFFQQNDNGGYSRISSKKLKSAQGTISGWPDVTLWKIDQGIEKTMLVEFKRPKETNLSPNQKKVHKQFSDAGKEVYLCNNTVYFEKVICKEFFGL